MRPALPAVLALLAACGGTQTGASPDAPGGTQGDGAIGDARGAHATTITVTLANRPNNATAFAFVVAYQDGASAWQLAPPPVGDVYTFQVSSPAYGVAWTCISAAGNVGASERDVNLYYFAVAERTSLSAVVPPRCSDRGGGGAALGGTIANPPIVGSVVAAFGARFAIAMRSGLGALTYAMETSHGTHDLIVGQVTSTFLGGNSAVAAAVVHRGLTVSGPTTADVDFAEARPLQTAPVTVAGPSLGARLDVSTTLVSAGGTAFILVHQAGAPFETAALADAQAAAGDVYAQQIGVVDGTVTALVQRWTDQLDAQDYSPPDPLGAATTTVTATSPYPILDTAWPAYPQAIGYAWQATQPQLGARCGAAMSCTVVWTIDASTGYIGAAPEIAVPDLSALGGWDKRLELVTGAAVQGAVTAFTSTLGPSDFVGAAVAPAGTQRVDAGTLWTITP